MADERVKRKISAILSADVVGYSRLMEADELATVQTVESYRKTVSSLISQHNGRVIDSPGDNILSEFGSVVDAVQCAVEVQHVIKAKNAVLPEARRMEFRIGINLGDVIEEEDRVYGDGINIASRLEGLADAGGICISGSAYEQVAGKLALGYVNLGEHSVRNIERPVQVYRIPMDSKGVAEAANVNGSVDKRRFNVALVVIAILIIVLGAVIVGNNVLGPPPSQEETKAEDAKAEPSRNEKPSIAVLPFENMSDDPKQEYFVDGMTEETIARLSMWSGITVISRNSTFYYKGKSVNIREIGEELGARYIVEGSVRKSANTIRVTAQLIEASTDKHLSAKTYERKYKEIFSLQDEIAQHIVSAIGSWDVLLKAEQSRIKSKPTEDFTAYENLLKAAAIAQNHQTKKAYGEASAYINKAIELDPDYSLAHLYLGIVNFMLYSSGFNTNPETFENALKEVRAATILDDSNAFAHAWLANLYRWERKFEKAKAEAERALTLNPNDDFAYLIMGVVLRDSGNPEEAIDYIRKSMRLNPHHDANYYTELADAYRMLGWHQECIAPLQKAIARNPQWLPSYSQLSDAYRSLGQYEKAIEYANEGIAQNPEWLWSYIVSANIHLDIWQTQQSIHPTALNSAAKMARKCAAVSDNSAICSLPLSIVYLLEKRFDQAISAAKAMVDSSPTNPPYGLLSYIYSYAGLPDKAAAAHDRATQNVAQGLINGIALLHSIAGRYDEAIASYRNGLAKNPSFEQKVRAHIGLAVMYSELGRIEEAKAQAAEILKLVPNFSVDVWGERVPYKDPALAERGMEGLRKAGLK